MWILESKFKANEANNKRLREYYSYAQLMILHIILYFTFCFSFGILQLQYSLLMSTMNFSLLQVLWQVCAVYLL